MAESVEASGPSPTLAAAVVDSDTDVDGYYLLYDSAPSWTRGFSELFLSTIEAGGSEVRSVPLWGFIRSRTPRVDYQLRNLVRVDSALWFDTDAHGDVSYSFRGRLRVLRNFPGDPPEGDVLVGLLRLLRRGTIVDSAIVRFQYTPGG